MEQTDPPAKVASNEGFGVTVVLGPKLFSFATFNSWCNHAQRIWFAHGVRSNQTLCVDQRGRVISWGEHFMTARDEGAFPVDVYLLRQDMTPNV